jgi:hypothetical protein
MQSMNWKLHIGACNNETTKTCHNISEIENYIKDLNIEHWVLEQTIDFNKYDEKPVESHMRILSSEILTPDRTIRLFSYLKQNHIECYDNLINFYDLTFKG